MIDLINKHKGESAWIVGKGPSLQYLKASDIGEGVVITLNQAIIAVEELNAPNVVYSLQKDGGDKRKRTVDNLCPICDYEAFCSKRCGDMVRPKAAILILHELESKYCFESYPHRYVLSLSDLGLERNVFSLIMAVRLALIMGCDKFNIVSCDSSINGDHRTFIPGKRDNNLKETYQSGLHTYPNFNYGDQKSDLIPYLEGHECKWITPIAS